MTAVGFVLLFLGLGGMSVMRHSDPNGWKLNRWSNFWAVLATAGCFFWVAAIAKMMWEVMP